MKQKISALLLALALFALTSCAPSGTEKEDATKQPEPPNALETEPSDPPETQTDTADPVELVRFDSKLGCSLTYDPALFTAEDKEDEYNERITGFTVASVWKNGVFSLWIGVQLLDASSVEEAVNDICSSMSLDCTHEGDARNEPIREEVTFGSGHYPAVRLTYNEAYAVGEIYVAEQNGAVYDIRVSSFHQPPEALLAQAYAILDSITF